MKILIWFGCLLLNSIVTVLINVQGILLGGIPTGVLFFLTCFLANKLCAMWDNHKSIKQEKFSSTTELINEVEETSDENEGIYNKNKIVTADNKKRPTKNRKCFCYVCGGAIDDSTKKCTSCGKQYFKGISSKKLLNIFFGTIILILLSFNIIQHTNYIKLTNTKNKIVNENNELKKEVKKLKPLGGKASTGKTFTLSAEEQKKLKPLTSTEQRYAITYGDETIEGLTAAGLNYIKLTEADANPKEYTGVDDAEKSALSKYMELRRNSRNEKAK